MIYISNHLPSTVGGKDHTVLICKIVKLCSVFFSAQSSLQKDIDQILKQII
jgi:hypothetical protein